MTTAASAADEVNTGVNTGVDTGVDTGIDTGVDAGVESGFAGVRVQCLRRGRSGETLFLMPGLDNDPTELAALAAALTGPHDVVALAAIADPDQEPVASLEAIAERMVAAVRGLCPAGPYRLGGYSFGGLLALETAQQLRADGHEVEALFLIEAIYDERYWPRDLWLRALLRRSGRHLARIVRQRPSRAVGELGRRAVRLLQRFARRGKDGHDPLRHEDAASAMAAEAYTALTRYRPRRYDAALLLIASSDTWQFGCDTALLWRDLAPRLVVERIEGNHLSVIRTPESAAAVAGIIDHQLASRQPHWPWLRPRPGFERPMIVTTMRWFAAARLAHALVEAGFAVSACRPRVHALDAVEGLVADHRLRRTSRLRSLHAALRATQPDVVLPDDEHGLALLRRLYDRIRRSDPEVAALIARSLGAPEQWTSMVSRCALATEAGELGVAAPPTAVVPSRGALRTWLVDHPLPVVLKTDGSWGGRGVAIAREPVRLARAWRGISRPPGLPRSLKRLLLNREVGPFSAWLRRARPVVNAQHLVEGREAIVTVSCLDGEVLQLVCLEVVEASEPRGPAAVVRVISHPGMAESARRLVKWYGLSGFCGFDFMLTDTGEAVLLELNPRVTPTCHLLVEGPPPRGVPMGLFPFDEARYGRPVPAVLDVPPRAPMLKRRGEQTIRDRQRLLLRMGRHLRHALTWHSES